MEQLLADAARRATHYLNELDKRPVAPTSTSLEGLKQLRRELQDEPIGPSVVLEELDTIGSPATVNTTGGRFFGFVIGGTLPAAMAANILAAAWDQNAGLEISSPINAELEKVCRNWLVSILGLPKETEVGFVTGATMANFTALAAARHAILEKQGWDVEANGLFGAPPFNIIVGKEVHVSVLKALSMLGLGRDRVLRIPVDGQGRMLPDEIPPIDGPSIVCIQAGNVNTGAFDPVGEIIRKLRGSEAWIHVDGAFGLWAAASPSKRHLVDGIQEANSWATDAHKWLNVPYDSGLVFVRDARQLNAAMSTSAAYLVEGETRDPHRFVPEMSRRARAIEIWAALRSLGKKGVADLIDASCAHAQHMAQVLRGAGFTVLNEVVLNQVLVSLDSPEATRQLIAAIQREGTCWCGGTVWQGKTAMRISVSSWASTEHDIDLSLGVMTRLASEKGGHD